MARAFGLAGSQAAGTFAAWGTPTVKFHQCRGALSGLMAALLAEQEFVATREFLTAKDGGLYQDLCQRRASELATAELGKRWELEQIALRLWPSASLLQGMNTALFDLIAQKADRSARERQELRVALSKPWHSTCTARFRATGKVRGADVGALHRGRDPARSCAHARAVRAGALQRSGAAACSAEQVEVRQDPALMASQADVELEMGDGARRTAALDHPRGLVREPALARQIEDKFRTYAKGRLAAPASRR